MNPCTCKPSPGLVIREGVEVCSACKRPPKKGENLVEAKQKNVKIRPSRKATRDMTEIEFSEWRELRRRVRLYEQTFGVRYSRD